MLCVQSPYLQMELFVLCSEEARLSKKEGKHGGGDTFLRSKEWIKFKL